MIAYEIQLRYVIRDKFSPRQIQSEKKIFSDHRQKNSRTEFCLGLHFVSD